MKTYETDSPIFSEIMDTIETTDPVHADLVNQIIKKLFENTLVLKESIEEPSGVNAGTYRSVTVDKKGRVTSGTNPTTLAGFGITNTVPVIISTTAPSDTTALWIS